MKWFIALLILASGLSAAYYYSIQENKAKRKPRKPRVFSVEAQDIKKSNFQTYIKSQGRLIPQDEISLSFGVQGKVIKCMPAFEIGSYVTKGQLLAELEDLEIKMMVSQSEAKLASLKLKLEIEEAEAQKDLREWEMSLKIIKSKDNQKQPSRLRARIPQMKSLTTEINAVKKEIQYRTSLLKRCKLLAPYNGYIEAKNISEGSYIQSLAQVGKIISTNFYLECPFPKDQSTLLKELSFPKNSLNIEIQSPLGHKILSGKLMRYSSKINPQAQQVIAIAEFNLNQKSNRTHFANQFVHARIKGPILKDTYVISETQYTPGKGILVISEDNTLNWISPPIYFRSGSHLIFKGDTKELSGNIQLCTTPLQDAVKGTKVQVITGDKLSK